MFGEGKAFKATELVVPSVALLSVTTVVLSVALLQRVDPWKEPRMKGWLAKADGLSGRRYVEDQ